MDSNPHLPRNIADKSEGYLVRPRKGHELIPPPVDHLVHIEPSEESDRDVVAKLPCVDADDLKPLSRGVMLKEDYPIEKQFEIHIEYQKKP